MTENINPVFLEKLEEAISHRDVSIEGTVLRNLIDERNQYREILVNCLEYLEDKRNTMGGRMNITQTLRDVLERFDSLPADLREADEPEPEPSSGPGWGM